MKPILIFLAFHLLSSLVWADSFTIVRDNREYLCEETTINPGSELSCAEDAYSGPFTRQESMQLCRGARSIAPSTCAKKAYAGAFTKSESLDLCTSARSTGPVDCANKAYAGPFTKSESLQLCRRSGTLANADCAIKAYAGPYSKEEALRLCRGEPQLIMRSLMLMERSPEIQRKIQLMKLK